MRALTAHAARTVCEKIAFGHLRWRDGDHTAAARTHTYELPHEYVNVRVISRRVNEIT